MKIFEISRKNIRLVCFDLDNTLYDYSSAEAETEAYIAMELHKLVKIDARKILSSFNEIKQTHMHHDVEPEKFSRRLWIAETIEKLGKHLPDDKLTSLEMKYWNYLVPKISLYPSTIQVLDFLKSKGLKLATITDSDGSRDIKMSRINKLGLDKYFDFIITTDDTGKNKPAMENWEHLIKISNMKTSECIMVGDHPDVDLINAKKLGFITVWSKQHLNTALHYEYVDYEITDIRQLLDILQKYNI